MVPGLFFVIVVIRKKNMKKIHLKETESRQDLMRRCVHFMRPREIKNTFFSFSLLFNLFIFPLREPEQITITYTTQLTMNNKILAELCYGLQIET